MPQPLRQRGLIRQWKLLRALEGSPLGLTFRQLGALAEPVCARTSRRDVQTLQAAGFPIEVLQQPPQPARVYLRQALRRAS